MADIAQWRTGSAPGDGGLAPSGFGGHLIQIIFFSGLCWYYFPVDRQKEGQMSELIENRNRKKELLKHMILELHRGQAPEAVKAQLARLLGEVPYDDVMSVEHQLIEEGLPFQEVLRLCDIHSSVLKGHISQ